MLDYEHQLKYGRLGKRHAAAAQLFSFAYVAARNFQCTNECHGWMGVSS